MSPKAVPGNWPKMALSVSVCSRSAARVYQRDPLLYQWMVSKAHNHPHGPEDFEQAQAQHQTETQALE